MTILSKILQLRSGKTRDFLAFFDIKSTIGYHASRMDYGESIKNSVKKSRKSCWKT